LLLFKNKTYGQGFRLVASFKIKVFVVIQVQDFALDAKVTVSGWSSLQGQGQRLESLCSLQVFKIKFKVVVVIQAIRYDCVLDAKIKVPGLSESLKAKAVAVI